MKGKSKLLKRISAWALCLVVVIATMNMPLATMKVKAATIIDSGTCGALVNWTLYNDGKLDISGSGDMDNFTRRNAPWNSYLSSISTVVIGTGITSIGRNAFGGCSNLSSVSLPSDITKIEESAFRGCGSLANIDIPSGVTYIGGEAFYDCGLTSITIPSGVTEIKSETFNSCFFLASINLPDGLTTIGDMAFYDCMALSSIEIPANVTVIGFNSFKQCDALNEVTFKGSTPPTWAGSGIEDHATRIIVPDGCKDAYANDGFPVSKIFDNSSPGGGGGSSNSPSNHHSSSTNTTETLHTHNLSWVTVSEPTVQSKGVIELRCTTCGHVADTHFVGNDAVVYESYANNLEEQLRTVTPGEDVLLELGEWHSVPSYMMERIISSNVDVELTYSYKGVDYDIVIPAGKGIDMHIPWYGPLLMYSIYG